MPDHDTTFRRFDDDTYYPPRHPALRMFGTVGSLAILRHKGLGPPFVKRGRSVWYRGSDLNDYLDSGRVETQAAA